MSSQPSSPIAPGSRETAGVAERDAVVWVGWRVEGDAAALRARAGSRCAGRGWRCLRRRE